MVLEGRRARCVRAARGYVAAAVLVAAVTAAGLRWWRFLGEGRPVVCYVLPVVVAALVGGARPALFAVALGALVLTRYFLPPFASLRIEHPVDWVHLGLFVATGVLIAVTAAHGQRLRQRDERARAQLREHQICKRALRESEARLSRLWESNLIGVFHADSDGTIYDANDTVLRMLGYSREDLHAGQLCWRRFTPPELLYLDEQALAEALARGACAPYRKEYVGQDGRRVPVLIGFATLTGTRTEHVCFVIDLTAQSRAEAALADQVTKAITDAATAALFMLDERGACTFMNPAAEAMIGWSLAEIEHRTLHEVAHHHRPDGRPYPVEECIMHRLLRAGKVRLEPTDEVFFRRGGEPFPVVCTARRIERPDRPPGVLVEVRDVTEQRRVAAEREALLCSERAARTEAERANREKDEFVAMLSHELRTPLNAIVGWTELAGRPGQPAEKVEKALAVVARNARSLAQIVADLLDESRIRVGKLRVDLGPVDLRAVIEGALDGVRAGAEAKGITLRARLSTGEAVVAGDAARLQQVVWNLVANAIKFTPRGGRVEVALEAAPSGFVITVSDTGEGIDPAFLPHLFQRFRQADPTISRSHGGLGLGLSIVRHLVLAHGGTVRGESEGPGRGSRFIVELPREEAPGPTPASTPEAAPKGAPRLTGARILVVDDEPDAKDLVNRLLEEQGALVVSVSSAPEALAALSRSPFDALISDIGMPGVDGYELVRRFHRDQPDSRVPAIALTAYARAEDRERALAAGFQAHLSKPVEPALMLATVARLLG